MIARQSTKSSRAPCRRQRRSTIMSCTPRLIQQSASKRVRIPLATKYVLNVPQEQSVVAPAATSSKVCLPHTLQRPQLREVDLKPIEAAYPELKGVPAQYIRDGLTLKGSEMLTALSAVHAAPPQGVLPKELDIILTDSATNHRPTHMLAVHSASTTLSQKRRVTLFPAHDLVLAAHCANLPSLPSSQSASSSSLPVVPLCLPSAETFSMLHSYLYTKRADALLAAILPASNDPCTLARHVMLVNGLWRNSCALGVHDENLWNIIGVAWQAVIDVMASTSC